MTTADKITIKIEENFLGDFFSKLDQAREEIANEDKEMRVKYEKINARNNWANM